MSTRSNIQVTPYALAPPLAWAPVRPLLFLSKAGRTRSDNGPDADKHEASKRAEFSTLQSAMASYRGEHLKARLGLVGDVRRTKVSGMELRRKLIIDHGGRSNGWINCDKNLR